MDSLRSFMDEMLNDQGRKEGFISDLLGNQKISLFQHWSKLKLVILR